MAGGNGDIMWDGLHSDELRVQAAKLLSENARLLEKRQASVVWKVLIAVLTAGSIAAGGWMVVSLFGSAKESITRGYATQEDLKEVDVSNTKAHKVLNVQVEAIDDRTDMMYQILVDKTPKNIVKQNIERKKAARDAAKPADL